LLAEDWPAAIGENARGNIGGGPWREPHDHMDRARRINVICRGRGGYKRQRDRTGGQMKKSATHELHCVPPNR
jgi:hypothetical protein